MKTKYLLSIFIICNLFWACENSDSPEAENEFDKNYFLNLINTTRNSGYTCGGETYSGVAPLSWNTLLEEAAIRHCADMNANNFLSHTGSDGSSIGDRITAEGYEWKNIAENIGKGYNTPDEVFTAWLSSEGHCANMLAPKYTEIGIAKSGEYWTLVVAKSKD